MPGVDDIPVDVWVQHLEAVGRVHLMTASKTFHTWFREALTNTQLLDREASVAQARRLHVYSTGICGNFFMLYRMLQQLNLLHFKMRRPVGADRLKISHRFLEALFNDDPYLRVLYVNTLDRVLQRYLDTNDDWMSTLHDPDRNDPLHTRLLKIHDYVNLVHRYLGLTDFHEDSDGYTRFLRKVPVVLSHVYNLLFLREKQWFVNHMDRLRGRIQLEQQELLLLSRPH